MPKFMPPKLPVLQAVDAGEAGGVRRRARQAEFLDRVVLQAARLASCPDY